MRHLVIIASLLTAWTGLVGQAPAMAQVGGAATSITQDQRILDAAGHFESITEQAYTASRSELMKLAEAGAQAVTTLSSVLSSSGDIAVKGALTDLRTALSAGTPPQVALAAVETYRALVSELSPAHPVPREVSLLDYAGFKIQALLRHDAADWAAIDSTLDYADRTWGTLVPRVAEQALRAEFTASLTTMRASATKHDRAALLASTTRELDLVDKLEAYFAAR